MPDAPRLWWPADLVDESMPTGLAMPQQWLAPDDDGVTRIVENDVVLATIHPGTTVSFLFFDDLGEATVLLKPDGSWSPCDQCDGQTIDIFDQGSTTMTPQPVKAAMQRIEAANWFAWDEDYDMQAGDMDQLARDFVDMDPPGPEGVEITIHLGFWSDGIDFHISADGRSLERSDG